MAKLRSPILGYNHNIRYRGLVFHVQSEDSGLANPHVFTHLFHGGVILTTRKLVYDASASEETVKSLMQSQHKAVLRDLKKGNFDDKIDAYLGGTPGLLPRGQGIDGEVAVEPVVMAAVPSPLPPEASFTPDPEPAPTPAIARTLTPAPGAVAIPPPSRNSGRMAAVPGSTDSPEARAPTERFAPEMHGASPLRSPPPLSPAEAQPPTVRDVSAAFNAILVEEGGGGGGLAEVPGEEGVVEIRSEAPGTAPMPPGVVTTPGSYAQHRRRESIAPEDVLATALPLERPSQTPTQPRGGAPTASPPPRASAPPPPPPSARAPGGMPAVRPPSPMARASSQVGVPRAPPVGGTPRPATAPPPPGYASARPGATSPPRPGAPQSRTRSPSGGGVVVTRPAVIIGAPARQVGGTAPPLTPQPPPPSHHQQAIPQPIPKQGSGRVRKAREDSDAGMFGQDLISEKSLDEVILAYLSEDGSED